MEAGHRMAAMEKHLLLTSVCQNFIYVKQSNSERDAYSQFNLQSRSYHRRSTFIHSAKCTSYTWVWMPTAEPKCRMVSTKNWDHLEMLKMKPSRNCYRNSSHIVNVCPRFITETPVDFNTMNGDILDMISKNRIMLILSFTWFPLYLSFGVKLYILKFATVQFFVSLLFLDPYVDTDTVSW